MVFYDLEKSLPANIPDNSKAYLKTGDSLLQSAGKKADFYRILNEH